MDMKTRSMQARVNEHSSLLHIMNEYLSYPLPRGHYEKRWHPDIFRYQGGMEMLRDMKTPLLNM
jgi:hypothetical protein